MEPMHKINKVEVRNLQIEDYIQLSQSFKRVYADKDVFWTHEQIETLIRIFPEGQVVTVVDDKIVGCALSIIVDYDMVKGDHTYAKVTGNETFCTHNPEGNILYGIEVLIHPDYRGLRLARRMYEYRKELCEKLNLKAIMFGGRIPNYYKYADTMRPYTHRGFLIHIILRRLLVINIIPLQQSGTMLGFLVIGEIILHDTTDMEIIGKLEKMI